MQGAQTHNVTARRCSSVYAMTALGPASAGSATLILDGALSESTAADDHRCNGTVV